MGATGVTGVSHELGDDSVDGSEMWRFVNSDFLLVKMTFGATELV